MSARAVWITGLSGAGKTTLAGLLQAAWIAEGRQVALLDGDRVRTMFGDDLGHGPEDRLTGAWRNARLCHALASEGFDVICATISMFAEVREWARSNVPGYVEVYLRVPEQERRRRDPKGLYRDAAGDMVGLGQTCELPEAPDLCIDNHGGTTLEAALAALLDHLDPAVGSHGGGTP